MKKVLIGIILGIVLSGTVIYAYVFYARDISYDNTNSNLNANNVQDAIDTLYDRTSNLHRIESGSINITNIYNSWQYQTIYFSTPFSKVPDCFYHYNAGITGGSVLVNNITTSSFKIGYNEFFSNTQNGSTDTIYWVCY